MFLTVPKDNYFFFLQYLKVTTAVNFFSYAFLASVLFSNATKWYFSLARTVTITSLYALSTKNTKQEEKTRNEKNVVLLPPSKWR